MYHIIMNVEGGTSRGRLNLTWREVIREDIRLKVLTVK